MIDAIRENPDPPSGLQEAAIKGKLIPFVGAGASRLAGCPDWSQFADRALGFFVDRGKLTHGQLAQIGRLNPRVKLSIALGLEKEHRLKIDFGKILHPGPRHDNVKGRQLYENLSKLAKTFVTTNYDEWLDETLGTPVPSTIGTPNPATPALGARRTVIYEANDLTPDKLRSNTVIHLHGSVCNPATMILTTQHYLNHYSNDRLRRGNEQENNVLTFLEFLFSHRNVLFVGYGLEELEILEYVIVKARLNGRSGSKEMRHFLLQGFFSHEQEIARSLKSYYEECGIELIPFLLDYKSWDQLIDVLDKFAKLAPANDPLKIQILSEMEALLE